MSIDENEANEKQMKYLNRLSNNIQNFESSFDDMPNYPGSSRQIGNDHMNKFALPATRRMQFNPNQRGD